MRRIYLMMMTLLLTLAVRAEERLVGGDLSMVPAYEQAGDQWLDADGQPISDMIAYVKTQGWNTVRVRLFIDPTQDNDPSTCQDIDYVKTLGKRVKDAGMKLLLDLHYSDTWADPGTQKIPASWQGMNDDQLAVRLSEYTTYVLQQMVNAGATPDMVQTGNEITYGLLWNTTDGIAPTEKNTFASAGYCTTWSANYNEGKAQWERTAKLLKAATSAVRTTLPSARIILHTELGNLTATSDNFYKHLRTAGLTDYDVIGLSYYPFWHGTLASLTALINTMKADFPDKKVEIVETAWYNTSYPADAQFSYEALGSRWKASAAGTVKYLQDLGNRLKHLDNVDGIFYWAPEECGKGYRQTVWPFSFNRGMWKSSSQQQHSMLKDEQGTTAVQALASYLSPATDEPDLSEAFTNLDFETGDLTGWTKDQEWTTMWPNDIRSWASADVVQGARSLELWNATSADGPVISQTGSVAKGRYLVTVRCKAEQSGFYLFANDRKTAIPANTAGMFSVEANATDNGMLTIGIAAAYSSTAKYIYADDFTVTYIGEVVDDDPQPDPDPDPETRDEFTDEQGIVYKLYSDHTAAVESGATAMGAVNIPSVLVVDETDYYVTSVLSNAFFNNTSVSSVTIGKNVTGIWSSAFNGCSTLSTIHFEEGSQLQTIDKWVFANTLLDSISVPAGVTIISEGCFSNCWALKYVGLLGEVTEIQQFAFSKWTADEVATAERNWSPLTNGVWFYGVTVPTISAKAFNAEDIADATLHVRSQNTASETLTLLGFKEIVAIDGTSDIYADIDGLRYYIDSNESTATLVGCTPGTSATRVEIPATITYDEQELNVTAIRPWAFYNNKVLQEVIVGENITTIPEGTFSGCSELVSADLLSEELNEIGDFAFSAWAEEGCQSGCPKLTTVKFHTFVNIISETAFYYDDVQALTTLYVPETDISYYSDYGFKAVLPLDALTGIVRVSKPAAADLLYNLSGQRISQPAHGIYVKKGRKVRL